MNVNALRAWGIAASAAMIGAALTLSVTARAPAAQAQPVEIAQASGEAPAPRAAAFLVRFRGAGPIASAQRSAQSAAARGATSRAQSIIETQLVRQRAFNGLCFDRFTAGAAEVVLRTCALAAPVDFEATQQGWLRRLQAMRAVEYADANATATNERAPS